MQKKFIVIMAGVYLLLGCIDPPSVSQAKKLIEAKLNDPLSVQYRDIKIYRDGTVCGEYNAKNKMGGYVGFQPFIYRGENLRLDEPEIIVKLYCEK